MYNFKIDFIINQPNSHNQLKNNKRIEKKYIKYIKNIINEKYENTNSMAFRWITTACKILRLRRYFFIALGYFNISLSIAFSIL